MKQQPTLSGNIPLAHCHTLSMHLAQNCPCIHKTQQKAVHYNEATGSRPPVASHVLRHLYQTKYSNSNSWLFTHTDTSSANATITTTPQIPDADTYANRTAAARVNWTHFPDPFRQHSPLWRALRRSRRRLRTVANTDATFREHRLTPRPPKWDRNPRYAFGNIYNQMLLSEYLMIFDWLTAYTSLLGPKEYTTKSWWGQNRNAAKDVLGICF